MRNGAVTKIERSACGITIRTLQIVANAIIALPVKQIFIFFIQFIWFNGIHCRECAVPGGCSLTVWQVFCNTTAVFIV